MQWSVRKRFREGVSFDLNYTWSKSTDLGSTRETDTDFDAGQIRNAWAPGQMKGVSDYDVTHIFRLRGWRNYRSAATRSSLTNANRLVDGILGGWQISGVFRNTSGLPAVTDNGGFWPTDWNVEGYATQLGPVKTGTNKNAASVGGGSGPNLFPDPAAALLSFANTLPGQSGQRNILRGDGYFGIDIGLGKRFVMPWKDTPQHPVSRRSFQRHEHRAL